MGYNKDSPKRCISLSVYIRQIKENPSKQLTDVPKNLRLKRTNNIQNHKQGEIIKSE